MAQIDKDLSSLVKKSVYFFDLDGTIYLGDTLFDGVLELIELLRKKKKKFYFLSNNSSKSSKDYLLKLKNLKIDISYENLILSQHPTIDYLKKNSYKRVFLMGTESLKEEFREQGFILSENDPEILVLAFDQELTYNRLVKAALLIQNDIPYIATHLDNRCPTKNGYIPDAGGIAALLDKATERMPRVFGKPNKEMILFKLDFLNIDPKDAVMFGDRLYTDIKMGINAGVTTCCVLSGESTLSMINKNEEFKPDFIIEGIWELLEALK
ncbi:MAG: HAD-IIA family hydrolase [Candidatus Lokiarchaeota archaeon]|nr:HAD-IIA family hydrolase [Candidatus Lokiarchaeota archaeon]